MRVGGECRKVHADSIGVRGWVRARGERNGARGRAEGGGERAVQEIGKKFDEQLYRSEGSSKIGGEAGQERAGKRDGVGGG